MGGERTKAQHDVLIADSQPADTQETLRQKRDITSAILDTAGVLIVVLDREGRIVRFNQAPERTTGDSQEEVAGKCVWDLFLLPQERESVQAVFFQLRAGAYPNEFENYWVTRDGERRLIKWANTALLDDKGQVEHMIGTGILLPRAFQHPEIVCARIILDDQEFHTENFGETAWQQTREIWVSGRRAGQLQVCYLEERREKGSGLFLKEEESLLSAMAERLGRIIERAQAQEALKRSEERYALAQRAANIGSWDWDIRTGDLRWSEQIEPMFGFGQGEFGATYEAFLNCVHPEDREYAVDQVVDLLVQLPVPVAHAGSFFRPDR